MDIKIFLKAKEIYDQLQSLYRIRAKLKRGDDLTISKRTEFGDYVEIDKSLYKPTIDNLIREKEEQFKTL